MSLAAFRGRILDNNEIRRVLVGESDVEGAISVFAEGVGEGESFAEFGLQIRFWAETWLNHEELREVFRVENILVRRRVLGVRRRQNPSRRRREDPGGA